MFPWWCGPGHSDPEHKLHKQDQTFGIAVQQTKVSDTPESFGQDMEQQAPEELSASEALDYLLACVVFDSKADDSLVVAKNILFRDHATIKVATEIDQCLISSTNCLAVNHPFLWQCILGLQAKRLDPCKDFGTKDLGEVKSREEVVLCLIAPMASLLIDHSSGHNHVHMRVIFKLSVVGMQHGMSADPSLQLWIATGKTIDCPGLI